MGREITRNVIGIYDGVCLHPICVFFGGMAEASMKEDEQGAHVEFWFP